MSPFHETGRWGLMDFMDQMDNVGVHLVHKVHTCPYSPSNPQLTSPLILTVLPKKDLLK